MLIYFDCLCLGIQLGECDVHNVFEECLICDELERSLDADIARLCDACTTTRNIINGDEWVILMHPVTEFL